MNKFFKILFLNYSFFLIASMVIIAGFFLFTLPVPVLAVGITFTVNDNGDDPDATLGDGICETVLGNGICTLRAAIEEADAYGPAIITFDSAMFPATVTPTTDLPPITTDGITISGPGASNLIIDDHLCGSGTGATHDAISIKASSVSVSGLTIHNSCNDGVYVYGAATLSNITVQNLVINNSYSNGIEFFPNVPIAAITGSTIANNTIDGSGTGGSADGIYLMYVDHTSISGNTITNSANNGIEVSGNSSYITISGNTVSTSANDGIAISGSSGDDHDIINGSNNITSNTGNGVSIADSDGTTISSNIFSSNGANGISLSNANSGTITSNTTNSNTMNGIYFSSSNNNATITDNTANHNTLDGITFSSSDINTISGNTFSSNARGIRLYSADSNIITDNTVSSNTLDGISFSDSDNNQVSSNTFSSNGTGAFYQTNPNYISYDDGNIANTDNPIAYVTLQNGIEKGTNFLVGGNYSAVKNNGDPVIGLDGTQDLYLALITDDPSDDNQYTFYTDKSQGDFLTWCQANVNALCNIDYYSSVPVWQHNGAYNNYTWNTAALPSGAGVSYPISSSVSTSYYTSSILSVNYGGSDYNQALLLTTEIPIVFYVGIPASGAGVFNIMTPGLVNNAFGFDGTTSLDLLLLDDTAHGGVTGKSAWVVPNSIPTSSLIYLLSTLGDDGNSAIEVCREPSVFTGNGDGNDYTFKPIVSWTVCSGATMSDGFADPATMIGYPATPPALDAGAGIYLQNSKSNIFTNTTGNILTGNENGISFSGISDTDTVNGGFISSSLGKDIVSSASGTSTLDNVSFDTSSTSVSAGQVDVYFDTRAHITDNNHLVENATCSLTDANSGTHSLGVTDASGNTSYSSVNVFNLDSSGYALNNNPFLLTASAIGHTANNSATINSSDQTIDLSFSGLNVITGTILSSPTLPKSTCKFADINCEGKVDILDFNLLMVNWGNNPTNVVSDLNSDGKVDVLDFNLLMVNWSL